MPSTLAGTIHSSAVHQLTQSPVTVSVWSACQSSMVKVLATMRVPGFMSRIFGRSFMLIDGSRNSVTTLASEKSVSNRSACAELARAVTPASAAFFCDSATMSGLYSMPTDRAPRLAAVITVRPSPEPRSMWKSCGVSLARSSIFSTSGWGVGTQTTSLPAWPTVGSNGLAGVCVCAGGRHGEADEGDYGKGTTGQRGNGHEQTIRRTPAGPLHAAAGRLARYPARQASGGSRGRRARRPAAAT